ncbi:MAG: DUF433 domain-containing protein [Flavobacteriaceae bacterium]|nr:DUF433 domain-containing protein [Flavobacteriaceae bacterium]
MDIGFENLEIGKGIYTVSDLALILKMPKSRARYWVNTYLRGDLPKITNFRYNFSPEEGVFITFNSLLELHVFEQLRQKGHSKKKILEAYTTISKLYNTKYPFTIKDIVTAGDLILLNQGGQLISANPSFQLHLKEVLIPYLEKIEFDKEGKAKRFFPSGKANSVVINPNVQFGSPVIKGTRINVLNLVEDYHAVDSIKTLAKIYNLKEQEINDAIEFVTAA